MKTRLQKSIEYITNYCDKHGCYNCKLQEDDGMCFLRNNPPSDWIELIQRRTKENK